MAFADGATMFRSSHWKCFKKKLFLNILQYSPENTLENT